MIIQQLLFGGAFSTNYPRRSRRSRTQTPRNLHTSDIDHHKRVRQRQLRDGELLAKDRQRAERVPSCLLRLARDGGNLRHAIQPLLPPDIPSFMLCE
jgi:hypothetical protein